jgi:simple sugar transport system ATP-binding protein
MGEALRMQEITKIYPNGFVANKDVNFVVMEGEIHALAGENGAGKTTLMKILFGMEDYQEGGISLFGKNVHISNPLDAIARGIGMVHQHFMQVPSLTVAENVTLGIEPGKGLLFDQKQAEKITQDISDKYQLRVNSRSSIADLSVGVRQKVEILKALARHCRILILDEPTAVLTPQETKELFVQLKALKADGISIIFISHKLDEVMELCDNLTVLRLGRTVGTDRIANLNTAKISRMMVGRDVILKLDKEAPAPKEKVVEFRGVEYINNDKIKMIDGLSFSLRAGEILGVAGVEGNGQNEIAGLLNGILQTKKGDILVNGKNIRGKSIAAIRKLGISFISEDRMRFGCTADLPIRENIMADRLFSPEFRKGFFLDDKKIKNIIEGYIKEFEIACDDYSQPVKMLSGGNIQKVIVAREFTSGANIIVANQPTRGIDVGTSEMIRKTLIRKSRENNVATLLISSDLNEVLEVSDRLMVMKDGKIVAHFSNAQKVSEEELGEYMLGVKVMPPEKTGEAT